WVERAAHRRRNGQCICCLNEGRATLTGRGEQLIDTDGKPHYSVVYALHATNQSDSRNPQTMGIEAVATIDARHDRRRLVLPARKGIDGHIEPAQLFVPPDDILAAVAPGHTGV